MLRRKSFVHTILHNIASCLVVRRFKCIFCIGNAIHMCYKQRYLHSPRDTCWYLATVHVSFYSRRHCLLLACLPLFIRMSYRSNPMLPENQKLNSGHWKLHRIYRWIKKIYILKNKFNTRHDTVINYARRIIKLNNSINTFMLHTNI